MKFKGIKERQAYHDRKSAELDRVKDPNKYQKRLERLMKYHRLLSELEVVEVKQILKGDGEMKKVNENVEIISGLDKTELEEKIFALDSILGGIELGNNKIQNINTELGRIGTDVENTDHTNLKELGITMIDISHMIIMLSDFMNYVSKDLNESVEKLNNLQSELSEAIKKA